MRRAAILMLLVGCSFQPGEYGTGDARGGGSDSGSGSADAAMGDAISVDAAPIPISAVQQAVAVNAGNHNFVNATFPAPVTAGNLVIAVVSWGSTSQTVFGITDDKLSAYFSANAQLSAQNRSQRIYYAANATAGIANVAVTVTGNVPDATLRIFEYSGIATSLPVDNVAAASGNSTSADVGPVLVRQDHELLFVATLNAQAATGPSTGFTERMANPQNYVEDQIVETQGPYMASLPLASSGAWIAQIVAFKGKL